MNGMRNSIQCFGWLLVTMTVLLTGCGEPSPGTIPTAGPTATNAARKVFYVKGVVKGVEQGGRILEVEHEEIPNYMEAMTMPFNVGQTNEMSGLTTNDQIHFRLVVGEEDSFIDQITKVGRVEPLTATNRPTFRLVREVRPLEVGDVLPNYPLTNQFGKLFHTDGFRGRVVVFSFIFTRCPLPDFCPRISGNLNKIRKALEAAAAGPTNWHLLSISFDVEFDTPAVLAGYAKRFAADPARWTFATGALIEIDDLTERFGLGFAREQGTFTFNHNLRTVVLDPRGRVHKVYIGNTWTPEEVVVEMKLAAAVKP